MPNSNYILTSNGDFISEDELYHYGVIGMKWGKRKADYYTNKANSHISKIGSSKTRLGKNYHNYQAYRNETKASIKKKVQSSDSGLDNLRDVYGSGGEASRTAAASKYYDRKSNYTKTRLGTTMAKAASYNEKTASEALNRLRNSKDAISYGKNYIDTVANRSVKTWSGRTTTTGKQVVDAMLTGGIVGTLSDINYYAKHK